MKVRARFACLAVEESPDNSEHVTLAAVTGPPGEDDNVQWSEFTPDGRLEMTITAKGATGFFKPGTDYYLDISVVGGE